MAATVNYAKYVVLGNTVHILAEIDVTGAGAGGNAIAIGGIPFTPARTGVFNTIGTGLVNDNGVAIYNGTLTPVGGTSLQIIVNALNYIGVNPNFALANGDIITLEGTYERT